MATGGAARKRVKKIPQEGGSNRIRPGGELRCVAAAAFDVILR